MDKGIALSLGEIPMSFDPKSSSCSCLRGNPTFRTRALFSTWAPVAVPGSRLLGLRALYLQHWLCVFRVTVVLSISRLLFPFSTAGPGGRADITAVWKSRQWWLLSICGENLQNQLMKNTFITTGRSSVPKPSQLPTMMTFKVPWVHSWMLFQLPSNPFFWLNSKVLFTFTKAF